MDKMLILIIYGGSWDGDKYTGGFGRVQKVPKILSYEKLVGFVHRHACADLSRLAYDMRCFYRLNQRDAIMYVQDDEDVQYFLSTGNEEKAPELYVTLEDLQPPQAMGNMSIMQPQLHWDQSCFQLINQFASGSGSNPSEKRPSQIETEDMEDGEPVPEYQSELFLSSSSDEDEHFHQSYGKDDQHNKPEYDTKYYAPDFSRDAFHHGFSFEDSFENITDTDCEIPVDAHVPHPVTEACEPDVLNEGREPSTRRTWNVPSFDKYSLQPIPTQMSSSKEN